MSLCSGLDKTVATRFSVGASAVNAAADVATETEETVIKGWTKWKK
jgi:hypothetical protein